MGQCASEPRTRRAPQPEVCEQPEVRRSAYSHPYAQTPKDCVTLSDGFGFEDQSIDTDSDVKERPLKQRRQGKAVVRPRGRYGWTCGGICTGSACTEPLRKPELLRDRNRPIKRLAKPKEPPMEAPAKRQRAAPVSSTGIDGGSVREIKLHHTTGKAQHLKSMEPSPVGKNHWVDFDNIAEQWTISILDSATNERTDVLVWDFYTVRSVRELINKRSKEYYPLYIQRSGGVYKLPDDLQLRSCPWIGDSTELISLSALALSRKSKRRAGEVRSSSPAAAAAGGEGETWWLGTPEKSSAEDMQQQQQQQQKRPANSLTFAKRKMQQLGRVAVPPIDTATLSPATPFSPCSPLGSFSTPGMTLEDVDPGRVSLDKLSPLGRYSTNNTASQLIDSPFKSERGS